MSKFKVGDEVILVGGESGRPHVLKNGTKGIILDDHSYPFVQFDIEKSDALHSADGLGEDKKCFTIYECDLELLKPKSTPSFKTSNRYKLHKYILSTGFTKQDLSFALNKNQSYLATETRESQFTNRGDMSDSRYKSLRKQIKEAVQIKSEPVDISVVSGEINQTLADVEPKAKEYFHYDSSIGLTGRYGDNDYVIYDGEVIPARFAVALDIRSKSIEAETEKSEKALDTFTEPKPSNNGAFILGLVFFVLLIIFGIGCLIYKAA